MSKIIKKSATFLAFIFGFTFASAKLALATARCVVNGQEIPCEELGRQANQFIGWWFAFALLFFGILIWAIVFWIMMIVHLAKHDVKDKVMWIILIVATGILGAFIYYFVIKRKFNKQVAPPMQATNM